MAVFQPSSPLDSIPNLEPVDPEKWKEFEDHLAKMCLPKVRQQQIEAAERVQEMRKVVLF